MLDIISHSWHCRRPSDVVLKYSSLAPLINRRRQEPGLVQRTRIDRASEASHDLIRLLDEPEGGIMDGPEKTARKAP